MDWEAGYFLLGILVLFAAGMVAGWYIAGWVGLFVCTVADYFWDRTTFVWRWLCDWVFDLYVRVVMATLRKMGFSWVG